MSIESSTYKGESAASGYKLVQHISDCVFNTCSGLPCSVVRILRLPQEEERPDRCQQARRLPEMRLPPRVPHDASSDTGSKAHAEVPASAGAADGADEEPRLRTADGDGRAV